MGAAQLPDDWLQQVASPFLAFAFPWVPTHFMRLYSPFGKRGGMNVESNTSPASLHRSHRSLRPRRAPRSAPSDGRPPRRGATPAPRRSAEAAAGRGETCRPAGGAPGFFLRFERETKKGRNNQDTGFGQNPDCRNFGWMKPCQPYKWGVYTYVYINSSICRCVCVRMLFPF